VLSGGRKFLLELDGLAPRVSQLLARFPRSRPGRGFRAGFLEYHHEMRFFQIAAAEGKHFKIYESRGVGPATVAIDSSCAKVTPPCAWISASPSVPSVPERITPMLWLR